MYICRIWSYTSHEREYEVNTKSAMKAAIEYGRCESGEVVEIITPRTHRVISRVQWTPENSGRYYRCTI